MSSRGLAAVLDAPSISVLRIDSAACGSWEPDGENQRQRVVSLQVVFERSLRGPFATGSRMHLDVRQVESIGRYDAPHGPWSGNALESGREYLVFAKVPFEAISVEDVAEADGVQLAIDFEENQWPLADLSKHVGTGAAKLGPVFGRYLSERFPAELRLDDAHWDSITEFLETPALAPRFRTVAATGAMDAVLMVSPESQQIARRTALMAFRLLSLPEQPGFHDRLIGTYLPALLGTDIPGGRWTARQIFAAHLEDRERAVKAMAGMLATPSRDSLLNWIGK